MEKKKMNYQNGKIYTIRSYQTDNVYYGSTTQPLNVRLSKHKGHYNRYQNEKYRYVTSFEIIKYKDCYIQLLENYPCNSKAELEKREAEFIRENNCVNKYIPCRSSKQYYLDNKDKIKQYREDNKDKIHKRHKQYYENNKDKIQSSKNRQCDCSCGGNYTSVNKARHMKTKKHITYIESIQSC